MSIFGIVSCRGKTRVKVLEKSPFWCFVAVPTEDFLQTVYSGQKFGCYLWTFLHSRPTLVKTKTSAGVSLETRCFQGALQVCKTNRGSALRSTRNTMKHDAFKVRTCVQNQPRVPGLTYKCLTCAGYLQHFQNLTYLHGLLMRLLHIIRKRFQPSRIESNPRVFLGGSFNLKPLDHHLFEDHNLGKLLPKNSWKALHHQEPEVAKLPIAAAWTCQCIGNFPIVGISARISWPCCKTAADWDTSPR